MTTKLELERLGFRFELLPSQDTVEVRVPDFRTRTFSRVRVVRQGDQISVALPAKNSFRIGYSWQFSFPARGCGPVGITKAIRESRSRFIQVPIGGSPLGFDTYFEWVVTALNIARLEVVRTAR